MTAYAFDVHLQGVKEITDDQADALFAAGCDDGTPAVRGGVAWVHFDREADSLEEAIRSAVAQVRSAGFRVAKVELDADMEQSPDSGQPYVLVPRDLYERMKQLLAGGSDRHG